MKPVRGLLVLVVFMGSATAASVASGAMVRRAGEWQTVVDGGKALVACAPHDAAFDKESMAKALGRIPNAQCATTHFSSLGPMINVTLDCQISGAHMVTTSTVTQTGPDAYTTKSHSHVDGGALKMPNGQSIPWPDQDMTSVSHRTGECKPGDRMMQQ